METTSFNITFQDQILHVEQEKDLNEEFFYKITFPDNEKIDIYVTPRTDGLAPNWAEGKGVITNRAKEIGELIEAHEE